MGKYIRPLKPQPHEDWLRRSSAVALAEQIKAYWLSRGYLGIRVWIEEIPGNRILRPEPDYAIRSNLVNGYPPRRPSQVKEAA